MKYDDLPVERAWNKIVRLWSGRALDRGECNLHGVQVETDDENITGSSISSIDVWRCGVRTSKATLALLFPDTSRPPPSHFAYIELFKPFPRAPDEDSGLYRVSRSYESNGHRTSMVVPVQSLYRSVQLFPRFGPTLPDGWTSYNVLEECDNFRMNSFLDHNTYRTVSNIA